MHNCIHDDCKILNSFHDTLSYTARPLGLRAFPRSAKLAGSKAVTFGQESRRKLVQGINIVADAVKVTLGPKGRNAVLGKSYGAPDIVNDGVTIGTACYDCLCILN